MLKILLVDDEREEREGLAYLINKYKLPLSVVQESNGKRALAFIEKHQVDILLTDIKMPFMDGLELAEKVYALYPHIKIIIFSAYGEFDYARRALAAKAVSYLLKPIEVDEFCNLINEVIGRINTEKAIHEEFKAQSEKNKRNLLYKMLTTGHLERDEEVEVDQVLLSGEHNGFLLINIEFMNSFYEEYEDIFIRLVRTYLGDSSEYVNILENEAYLIIRDDLCRKVKKLKEQLEKLVKDISRLMDNELSMIVGDYITSSREAVEQVRAINNMRMEMFGYSNSIVWVSDNQEKAHYVTDVELVKKQLFAAIETDNTEMIRELWKQMIDAIAANNMMSRIYIQNMLYSVIRSLYDKNPQVEHEDALKLAELLFQSKNSTVVVEQFTSLLEKMLDTMDEESSDRSGIIHRICNIVEKEYMKDLSLNYVAECVNLSPAYVSYIFKKKTGLTLIKYITDTKMKKAQMLLDEGKLKVNEIARICGYENQSYFNRLFKNYYGVTPKQYRER